MEKRTCINCRSTIQIRDGKDKNMHCPYCGGSTLNIYDKILNSRVSDLILGCLLLLKKEGCKISDIKYKEIIFKLLNENIIKLKLKSPQSLLKKIKLHIESASKSEIFDFIQAIELLEDVNDIPGLFDKILLRDMKRGDIAIQPTEVTKFISSLIALPDNALVYNPFGGFASYGLEFGKKCQYFGQEINDEVWAIATIRLLLNEVSPDNFVNEDSVINWNSPNEKYDLIISTTPYGARRSNEKFPLNRALSNRYNFALHNLPLKELSESVSSQPSNDNDIEYVRTIEEYFFLNSISNMNCGGLLVALMPLGILHQNAFENLRRLIVDSDLLEVVITLPSNQLYPYTVVPACIVILNQMKTEKGVVRLFDFGSNSVGKIEPQDNLIQFYRSNINFNNQFCKTISIEEIKNKGYRLYFQVYNFEETPIPEGFNAMKLGEILSPIQRNFSSEINGRFIRLNKMATNCFDYSRKSEDFDLKELTPRSVIKISSDVIITSAVSINLKPTYCTASEESPIYSPSTFNCFKIIDSKQQDINLDYLIYELNSDKFKEQLSIFFQGTGRMIASSQQILALEILIPQTIEEQAAIALGAKRSYQQSVLKREGLEEYLVELKKEYLDNLSDIRHDLKHIIWGAKISTDTLMDFLAGKDYKNEIVHTNRNFADILKGIKKSLNDLSSSLQFLNIDTIDEMEKIDLNTFLLSFSFGQYPIDYIVDIESFNMENVDDEGPSFIENCSIKIDAIVMISQNDFKKVLFNIFNNAVGHGFTDRNKDNYRFRVYLRNIASDDQFMIEIWNNGVPFVEGMTTESYTKRGFKNGENSGEGLGGYIVNKTIKLMHGKLEIQKDLDDEFKVGIVIKLPKYVDYE